MRSFRFHLVLVAILLSATCASAQAGQDAQMILDRCAQAMGSPRNSLSVLAEGEVHAAGSQPIVAIRIKTRGIEDFRSERDVDGQTDVSVISKGRGWHHRQDRRWDISRHTTAYFRPDHLPALSCAISSQRMDLNATYMGEDVVGSEPVFHLKLEAQARGKNTKADAIEALISEYHLFIAQKSFVVLKTSKYLFSPTAVENHSLWETFYSDYRNIDGVLIPFHIENRLSGREFSTTIFTTVQTGVPLGDEDFKEAK